ncbi:MAG: SLAP domain-containing protein [Clostridia bacterium]
MFSFFKNWFQKDEQLRPLDEIKKDLAEESIVKGETASNPNSIANAVVEKVRTELSLHPGWEERLDHEKKYTLRFLQADLPEMDKGTIGVAGFSLIPAEDGVTVALFFRNAMERAARFENVTLSVYLDDRLFAQQSFDMSGLGAIPPGTSRPWEVFFPTESFQSDNLQFSRWKVTLNIGKRTHVWPKFLDLDPEMEARMSDRQKERLQYIVDVLPSMQPNQIEHVGFYIGKAKSGNLVVGMLIRNATQHEYAPETLDVRITDGVGDVIAKGTLDTTTLRVRPHTSRPWMLVFPAEIIRKPSADLSEWHLQIMN